MNEKKEKKSKNRSHPILRMVAGTLLFILAVSYLFDNLLNGIFAEWFSQTFVLTDVSYEEGLFYNGIHWPRLKDFFFGCLVVGCFGYVFSIDFFRKAYAKKKTQELLETLSCQIDDFLEGRKDIRVFSKEFSSISLTISRLQKDAVEKERLFEREMQQKNDLITYLAHDLKTPLASVIGYLCLLEETPDLPESFRQQYTSVALEKAYRLEQLINEFFEITRYNLHTIVLNPGKIPLKQMLLQMADEFFPILEPQKKTIRVEAPSDLILVADADKLARVFNNILKNAASYSDPGTEITAEVSVCGSKVNIVFTDQGTPIPKHLCETIFEKFYRLDSSRSSKTGGSGLGLAIAKEIVEAHHGAISVKSDIHGTSFTVTLPLRPD